MLTVAPDLPPGRLPVSFIPASVAGPIASTVDFLNTNSPFLIMKYLHLLTTPFYSPFISARGGSASGGKGDFGWVLFSNIVEF